MRKKFVILGLVLLLAGAAVLGWVIAEKKKEQQQVAHYKLKYGSEPDEYLKQYNQWLQSAVERTELPTELEKYRKDKTAAQLLQEQQERLKADLDKLAAGEMAAPALADILYGENWQQELDEYKAQKEQKELILTSSIVCTFTGGGIVSWWLLLWTARLIIRCSSLLRKFSTDVFRRRGEDKDKQLTEDPTKEDSENSQQQKPLKKHSKVLINSGWHDFEATTKCGPMEEGRGTTDERRTSSIEHQKCHSERSVSEVKNLSSTAGQMLRLSAQHDRHRESSTLEHEEPIRNSLKELTQQVSAIREYASQQQDRVEKLQDGYDWNIIRTFCLRVIRCIDNLENRIDQLSKQNIETTDLEEVRDELIFALESSGVEQFEPEINSDYRGQEKNAEAVKDRKRCKDSKLTGKIAKVIRSGYRYFIDEENVKVVRAAQVKLFG